MPEFHPIQIKHRGYGAQPAKIPETVALRAYEVYCHHFSPQEALITGGCRGGFGLNELIAFLYARSFPKEEWKRRVDEAHQGFRDF